MNFFFTSWKYFCEKLAKLQATSTRQNNTLLKEREIPFLETTLL